jgi:hypothetical protein
MNQPERLQFSMYNLLQAMLPLAVAFSCLTYESRHGRNLLTATVIVFGLTAAGGTLVGGWRGMIRALGIGFGATLLGITFVLMLTILLIFFYILLAR